MKILNTLSFHAVAFLRPKKKNHIIRVDYKQPLNILKGFETMIFPERMRGLPLKNLMKEILQNSSPQNT